MDDRQPVGLLAGFGRFPILFAEKARRVGLPVVCVGLRGEASAELAKLVDTFHWVGLGKMGGMIRAFKREGVRKIIMAGKIHKANLMYSPWRWLNALPDWRAIKWWYFRRRRDNKDDTLLLSVIDEFGRDGLEFESALTVCPELLVPTGVLTKREPTLQERRDIAFGWEMAKRMGDLDVGQSVAVKEQAVLAVEAIEGTDKAILRAGELCRNGKFVVVKVAKPKQDMRFDVPTIGCSTIETMHQAGGRILAIEADRTIVLDQDETIALANRYGIAIVVVDEVSAKAVLRDAG